MPCAPDSPKIEPITTPKPAWLRRRLPSGPEYERLRTLLRDHHLTTVCQQALCPNQFECFGRGTATFLLLGERCTRTCRFCAIGHGPLGPPDPDEPQHVAEAVRLPDLRRVDCDLLTIGQYLQPSRDHLPVARFVPPEEFAELRDEALALGFRAVAAGPFVRSSYQAETLYREAK